MIFEFGFRVVGFGVVVVVCWPWFANIGFWRPHVQTSFGSDFLVVGFIGVVGVVGVVDVGIVVVGVFGVCVGPEKVS